MNPKEYVEFIRSNTDLPINGFLNDCPYRLIYKPLDYMVAMESDSETLSKEKYDQLKQRFGDGIYVDVNMGRCEKSSNYNLFLITALDTVQPVFRHRESNGGVAPYTTDLFIFSSHGHTRDLNFLLEKDGISTELAWSYQQINSIPTLNKDE